MILPHRPSQKDPEETLKTLLTINEAGRALGRLEAAEEIARLKAENALLRAGYCTVVDCLVRQSLPEENK